jgi:hypothetical protein
MLGEQIAELKGKIIGQRVLDIEGPTIETSVAASGSYKGTQVKETLTFVGRPTSTGVLHGEGRGVIMAEGVSEMATYTGEGVGRISSSGSINWRGSVFYRTSSNGKLAFLDNLVGVFEVVIDDEGNFSEKDWEWK